MTKDRLNDLATTHPHETARQQAEADRREAIDDFWRGADAAWSRVQQGMAERVSRSARRLQVRLDRRAAAR